MKKKIAINSYFIGAEMEETIIEFIEDMILDGTFPRLDECLCIDFEDRLFVCFVNEIWHYSNSITFVLIEENKRDYYKN